MGKASPGPRRSRPVCNTPSRGAPASGPPGPIRAWPCPAGRSRAPAPCCAGDFGATMPIHYPGWTDPLCADAAEEHEVLLRRSLLRPRAPGHLHRPVAHRPVLHPAGHFRRAVGRHGADGGALAGRQAARADDDHRRRGLAGVFADLSSHQRKPAGLFRLGPGGPRGRLARRDAVDGRALSRVLRSAAAAGRPDGRLRGLLGRRAALRHQAAAPHGLSLELEVQRGLSVPGHVPARRRRPHPWTALAPGAAGRGQGAAGLVRHDERLRPMDAQPGFLRAELLQRGGVRQLSRLARPAAQSGFRRGPLEGLERFSSTAACDRRC